MALRQRLLEKYESEIKKSQELFDLSQKRALLDEHEVDCLYASGRQRSPGGLVRDGLFRAAFLKAREGRERRMDALVTVMCSIPAGDYGALAEVFRSGEVLLSIPKSRTLGHVADLGGGHRREFYLSPVLEDRSAGWVLYVTAHELAHTRYHLDLLGSSDALEREADEAARRWGFPQP